MTNDPEDWCPPAISHSSVLQNAWRRSQLAGVNPTADPGNITPTSINPESRLYRSAQSTLAELQQDLDGEPVGVLVTDRSGVILKAVAGNHAFEDALHGAHAEPGMTYSEGVLGANAVGTVIESGLGVRFRGVEHFNESMREFSCLAVPIQEPIKHRTLGVVNLCCHISRDDALSTAFVRTISRQLIQRYVDQSDAARNRLHRRYEAASDRYDAVVAMSPDSVFVTSAAMALLRGDDLRRLQEYVAADDDSIRRVLPDGIEIIDENGSGVTFWVSRASEVTSNPVVGVDELLGNDRSWPRIDALERDAVIRALRATGGNKVAAAAWLGISRRTIYNKIARFKISASEYDGRLPENC